jgi:hypothetical protein
MFVVVAPVHPRHATRQRSCPTALSFVLAAIRLKTRLVLSRNGLFTHRVRGNTITPTMDSPGNTAVALIISGSWWLAWR